MYGASRVVYPDAGYGYGYGSVPVASAPLVGYSDLGYGGYYGGGYGGYGYGYEYPRPAVDSSVYKPEIYGRIVGDRYPYGGYGRPLATSSALAPEAPVVAATVPLSPVRIAQPTFTPSYASAAAPVSLPQALSSKLASARDRGKGKGEYNPIRTYGVATSPTGSVVRSVPQLLPPPSSPLFNSSTTYKESYKPQYGGENMPEFGARSPEPSLVLRGGSRSSSTAAKPMLKQGKVADTRGMAQPHKIPDAVLVNRPGRRLFLQDDRNLPLLKNSLVQVPRPDLTLQAETTYSREFIPKSSTDLAVVPSAQSTPAKRITQSPAKPTPTTYGQDYQPKSPAPVTAAGVTSFNKEVNEPPIEKPRFCLKMVKGPGYHGPARGVPGFDVTPAEVKSNYRPIPPYGTMDQQPPWYSAYDPYAYGGAGYGYPSIYSSYPSYPSVCSSERHLL